MDTKVYAGSVNGIDLQFIDLIDSGTPACVYVELQRDDYGLEQITLTERDTVIDIGANIGTFSIYVKKKFNCRVISFEPVPINFEHFKQNIVLNGLSLSDFELHNTAIFSKEGELIEIGTPLYNSGGSSIFHKGGIISKCKTEKLHKYIDKEIEYLKIDTEGAEFDIIPDILDIINKFKYIGIEYHTFTGNSPIRLHELIKEHYKGVLFCQQPVV